MRKQIPFKASIRQPIRTFIFVLLVGLASFGFVSRAVEYTILNREMNRIEQFYRTVGALVPIDPLMTNNVYEAAELIRNSPFMAFEDRRTVVQGVMDGILNPMRGHHTFGGDSLERGMQPFAYKGLQPFDTIMVVYVDNIWSPVVQIMGETEFIPMLRIAVRPEEILYGHPQFIARLYMATFMLDEAGNSMIDRLEIGGRYMVRAVRQTAAGVNPQGAARGFGDGINIDFFPLYDDVYFVNMSDEAAVAAAFEQMAGDIAILNENTHMLMITGTRDMTAMPFVQSGMYQRFQGRLITEEDYLNANPVIVVPQSLDSRRVNARVGETITLTLRDMRTSTDGATITPELRQHIENMNALIATGHPQRMETFWWALPDGVEAHWRNIPAGYWVGIPANYEGDWKNYPTIEIEVEVVGTYVFPELWYNLPRWQHISVSYRELEAFVPASIIPEGWGIADAHMVSGQYSFLLNSPGDDIPFMAAYGSQLEYLGFTAQFLGEDPTNFLLSAVPIRNAIIINLLLFSAVLALVLMLTVFLYLWQRYKEFAILRALGISEGNAIWQVMMPVVIFWLPVVAIASIGAWFFALNQAAESLQILAEVGLPTDYGEALVIRNILDQMRYDAAMLEIRAIPQLSLAYLVWLCAGLMVAWLGTVLAGTVSFASKSMISLIQGVNSGGAPVRTIKETAPPMGVKISDVGTVLLLHPVRSAGHAIKSNVRHHGRHILRAPVKSVLVVAMALLFIVALGWLDNTIEFTEQEIERLYATTVITGEIVTPGAGIDGALWGYDIPLTSLEILAASDFVASYNTTALTRIGLFAPVQAHENMQSATRIEQSMLSIVKTISDMDYFLQEVTRPAAFGMGIGGEFALEFAPGFGIENFLYTEGEILPVIVHESLLTRNFMIDAGTMTAFYMIDDNENVITQNLRLGDAVYLLSGQLVSAGMGGWAADTVTSAVIIGTYSGGHPSTAYRMGQGLILVPDMRWTHFATVTFTMAQDKIHYLREFEEEMNALLTYIIHHEWYTPGWGMQFWQERYSHEVVLNDAEFRMVVIPLEENLSLLRLLYPVAKVMSFVLALGLSLLLMLQNAKNAAILRVLGMPRYKTRLNLCIEQVAVCAFGVAVGLVAVLVLGVGIATSGLLVGIYIGGALVGTVTGVVVISQKAPMELLQVRE